MLTLRKVAVTGGIASGKSTVCRIFGELGAYTVSADKIVHQFLTPSTALGLAVIALLGEEIVEGDQLNRELIAKKVFNHPILLLQLEKLIHPIVQKEIEVLYQRVIDSPSKYPLFVAEVPLLFESGQEVFYDTVIFVEADEAHCRDRFIQSGKSETEYDQRTRRLLPLAMKKSRADICLKNEEDLQHLRRNVESIFNSLKETL